MKRDLIKEITSASGVGEPGLRVTLSRIKNRYDLRSIQQAACFYIKKKRLRINVSSVIDDVTRRAVDTLGLRTVRPTSATPIHKPKVTLVPQLRWVDRKYYALATRLGDFYPYVFIFENALRTKIEAVMSSNDSDWWESKIKVQLRTVYDYAAGERSRQGKLAMIGNTAGMKQLDYLTVGHLEDIVVKYHPDFIPSIFPSLHFFTGHMVIVKRVRNSIAHMAPSTTSRDIKNAKSEIDILLQHLATL